MYILDFELNTDNLMHFGFACVLNWHSMTYEGYFSISSYCFVIYMKVAKFVRLWSINFDESYFLEYNSGNIENTHISWPLYYLHLLTADLEEAWWVSAWRPYSSGYMRSKTPILCCISLLKSHQPPSMAIVQQNIATNAKNGNFCCQQSSVLHSIIQTLCQPFHSNIIFIGVAGYWTYWQISKMV